MAKKKNFDFLEEDPKEKYQAFKDEARARRINYKFWGILLIVINAIVVFLNAVFADKPYIVYSAAFISFVAGIIASIMQFGNVHKKYINTLSTISQLNKLLRDKDSSEEFKKLETKEQQYELLVKRFNEILNEYDKNELESEIGSVNSLEKFFPNK